MTFYKPRITVCGIEYFIDATHSGSVFHVLEHYVNSILSFRTKNGQSCVLKSGCHTKRNTGLIFHCFFNPEPMILKLRDIFLWGYFKGVSSPKFIFKRSYSPFYGVVISVLLCFSYNSIFLVFNKTSLVLKYIFFLSN